MTSGISHEDFEQLQTSLIELRNKNYEFIEKAKKQDSALAESITRANKLEEELTKANNVIQKSKKISEVEKLARENESLQRKLLSQEDEFRLQNQTLLQELSKLVTANEEMEKVIKNGQRAQTSQNADILNANHVDSEKENNKLRSEVARLQVNVFTLEEEKEALQIKLETLTSKSLDYDNENNEAISISSGSVSFSRIGSYSGQSFSEEHPGTRPFRDAFSSGENEKLTSENIALRSQLDNVQSQLKKKKESFLLLQNEKEGLYNSHKQQTDELKASFEQEIIALKDQVNRLQIQLKNGHTGFADFKGLKQAEIEDLKKEIAELKEMVENCPPEKFSEATNEISRLASELSEANQLLKEISSEKNSLVSEVGSLKAQLLKSTDSYSEIEIQFKDMSEKYHSTKETNEKRKQLLDDMSISIQTKKTESDSKIHCLEAELQDLNEKLSAQTEAFNAQSDQLISIKSNLTEAEEEIKKKIDHESKLVEELNTLKIDHSKKITNLVDKHSDEQRFAEAEWKLKLQDLTTQIEIANAQRAEFEDLVRNHQQELNDLGEERKIREKKSQGLVKDLKRQLVAEQHKNTKLSEKIKELLKDQVTLLDSDQPNVVEADRTSNSSWSIYSDNNDLTRESNISSTPLQGHSSGSEVFVGNVTNQDTKIIRSRAQSRLDFSAEDYQTLLCKIAALQDEKINLQNQLQMLEQSSAAMADDLLKKSSVIQFYCMDNKAGNRVLNQAQSSGLSPGLDKLKVKKVVEMLVNQHTDSKEEVQRMQKMLEETLMKNMYLQKDLENLSLEVVRLSKLTISPSDK